MSDIGAPIRYSADDCRQCVACDCICGDLRVWDVAPFACHLVGRRRLVDVRGVPGRGHAFHLRPSAFRKFRVLLYVRRQSLRLGWTDYRDSELRYVKGNWVGKDTFGSGFQAAATSEVARESRVRFCRSKSHASVAAQRALGILPRSHHRGQHRQQPSFHYTILENLLPGAALWPVASLVFLACTCVALIVWWFTRHPGGGLIKNR